jgi:hypothetical protein
MKRCPSCNRAYEIEKYCKIDGSPLVADSEFAELDTQKVITDEAIINPVPVTIAGRDSHFTTQPISPLEIIFEPSEPYFQIKSSRTNSGVLQYRSDFRIGIKNTSGKTINNVSVKIEELNTGKTAFYNVPLRILHDNQPYRNEFNLDPKEQQIIEVATRETWERTISICRTNRVNAPDTIPANQRYEFTIKATGLDTLPCMKRFSLIVGGSGKLDVSVSER